jgi:uncharacterized membrane protein YgdD (TMEM256/DUF423 family)
MYYKNKKTCMRVNNFSNYTKMYESRLQECDFFREQNITADDIITPLEDLVNEEFLDYFMNENWVGDLWAGTKKVAGQVWDGTKKVFNTVKDAIAAFFGKIVDFFKNFSLSKLISGIWEKIKSIGSAMWNKIKEALGSLKEFIVGNDMVDENNKPKFGNIWSTLCQKGKDLVGWEKEGVTPEQLAQAGEKIKINESDAHSIGDDEVKYYGMFEKIAHALGVKNARFNGVVSQIMKKGTYGLIIMGILKFAGLSLGALTLGMSPIAMAAIGGMLLMAGLIILAIWVCKPYPTVDDCLAYLHIAFGGNCAVVNVPNIFVQNINYYYINNTTITNTSIANTSISNTSNTNNTSLSNTNVNNTNVNNTNVNNTSANNTNVNNTNVNNTNVNNTSSTSYSNSSMRVSKSELRVGQEYIYTSKKGQKIVKVVSLTNDVLSGKDKKWLTGDDQSREKLKDGYVDVIYQDKDGEYTTTTNFVPILISKLTPLNADLQVGQEYIYKNREGKERVVKVVSLTHDTLSGKDKKWLTGDDKKREELKDEYVDVIYQDKNGEYTTSTNFQPILKSRLTPLKEKSYKESLRYISSFEKYNNK